MGQTACAHSSQGNGIQQFRFEMFCVLSRDTLTCPLQEDLTLAQDKKLKKL